MRSSRSFWSRLPLPPVPDHSVPWSTLESLFTWYDRQAGRCRVVYQTLKVLQLLLAACLPIAGALGASVPTTATLGAAVLVLESVQQLFSFHTDWISYRATAESLRREALLYSAGAAPYSDPDTRGFVLAERLVGITTGENDAWISAQRAARDATQLLERPGQAS